MSDIIIREQRHQFIPHSGWSKTVPTANRFADRMVEHGDLKRAAAECGIGNDYANSLRTRLRKLGMDL
jgi:hypothetical protein